MPRPSSSGRRNPRKDFRPVSMPRAKSDSPKMALHEDRARLDRDLEDLLKKEAELRKLEEKIQRRVAELPKQIEERERKQREMIRLRAMSMATYADGVSKPQDKRHAPLRQSSARRMTRPEQRTERLQFLMLCVVLAVILILLWKSLP